VHSRGAVAVVLLGAAAAFGTPPLLTVPEPVRAALGRLGCPVPPRVRRFAHPGVTRGRFMADTPVQWAAECGPQVVVLTPGRPFRVDTITATGDWLTTADAERIRVHLDLDEAPYTVGLGVIQHDGVEVGAGDCCSSIFYWDGRRWRELPGAD
jgi:hypothetical protein